MQHVTRVTIALPRDLWEKVKRSVPSGKRSGLIAQALESELRRRQRLEGLDQLRQFQADMQGKYGKFPSAGAEIARGREERDHELDRGG